MDPVTQESFQMRRNFTRLEAHKYSHPSSSSSSVRDSMGGYFENDPIRGGANLFFREDNEDTKTQTQTQTRTKIKIEDHKKTNGPASATNNKDETKTSDTNSFIDISMTPSDSTETISNENPSKEERPLLRQLSWIEKEQITKGLDLLAKIGEAKPRSTKKRVKFLVDDRSESEEIQEPRRNTAAVNVNIMSSRAAPRFRDWTRRSQGSRSYQAIMHTYGYGRENREIERSTTNWRVSN